MAQRVKIGRRVPLTSKVTQEVRTELRRVARRHEELLSRYVAKILLAHTRGTYLCPECGVEHAIHSGRVPTNDYQQAGV